MLISDWYWRIYKKQDYENVERGLYVKITHVNYDILLMDCDLELSTFTYNCIRGFKHIHRTLFSCKFCFSVSFLCVFGIRMCSIRGRPRDSLANFGSKRFVTDWVLTRGKGVKANGDKGGQK